MVVKKFNPNVFGQNYDVQSIHGGQHELANKAGYQIKIEHLASGMKTSFQAFLESYSDAFQSNWTSATVYGRMDPIQTFQGTSRRISLGWAVPSNDASEAEENLLRCQNLAQMMYPVYGSLQAGATSIKAPPLLRLSFVNLIDNAHTGRADKGKGAPTATGLVGTCDGFQFAPEVDTGFHDPKPAVLFPKLIKVFFNFTVLHTHALGFVSSGKKVKPANDSFPWNVKVSSDSSKGSKVAPKGDNLASGVKNVEPKKAAKNPAASRSAKKGIAGKIKKSIAGKTGIPDAVIDFAKNLFT